MKTTRSSIVHVAFVTLPPPIRTALVMAVVLLAASFTGCSKHPPTPAASPNKESVTQFEERRAVAVTQSAEGKDTVLPGRHMSESQVAAIAFRELPRGSSFRCEFKNGVWEILEVQKGVWGASSVTTNADGRVFVASTNVTQVILKVQDADGKVVQVKTP